MGTLTDQTGPIDEGANVNIVDKLLDETLGQLHGASSNPEVEDALKAFAQGAVRFTPLQRALARTGAIRGLDDMKVKGAARLLDAALATYAQTNGAHNTNAGQAVAFADPEPWSDSVDGAVLLDTLQAFFRRFLILPTGAADVLATFALVTHAADAFRTVPYVALESPTPECGKTRVLEILALLSARPWFTLMPSTAVLFRVLEQFHPTMLLDECQAVRGRGEAAENVRDLLLAGYKRGAKVPRCVGDQHEVRFFDVFGPKVFALIGELPGALASRCIRIGMQRRRPQESVDSLLGVESAALALARKARRWANDHREGLQQATPPFPGFLRDRLAEIWQPLLTVGMVAGGGWDTRLMKAARALAGGREDDDVRTLLLADIRTVFAEHVGERISSAELVADLTAMEGRPWADWKGRELTPNALARLLKPLQIAPKKLWIDAKSVNGYETEAFADAWARYTPASQVEEPEGPSNDGGKSDSATGRPLPYIPLAEPAETPAKMGNPPDLPLEKQEGSGGEPGPSSEVGGTGDGPGLEPLGDDWWDAVGRGTSFVAASS